MADLYGAHVRFSARDGQVDALVEILVGAAGAVSSLPDCLVYFVSRDPAAPDVVWVTECWTSQGAHDASLTDPAVRELVGRAVPLLAGSPELAELRPVGGKPLD